MENEINRQIGLLASIDIGSNSFHMVVARLENGELRPIERAGEKVQLAANMVDGLLHPKAIERGLACLRRFKERLDLRIGLSIRVVATNALRTAINPQDFIGPAEQILGCPVDVIAGREEARLIYLGVAHAQADDDDARLVIDVGGGSTEIIVGKRFEPVLTESLHMGCVSYLRFFPNGKITRENFQQAYNAAFVELVAVRGQYAGQWSDCVGASGTLQAIEQVLIEYGFSKRGIRQEDLVPLLEMLLTFGKIKEVSFQGLKEDRRQVFASGLAITMALFDALDIDEMRLSDGALREGVLYDFLGRLTHEDVRERSIKALELRYDVDTHRADIIERYAMNIFEQLAEVWQLQAIPDRQLLIWAARLHEIGLAVSHSHFHKHGEYIIRHTDLSGFSRAEQQALSLLVRAHRRRFPVEAYAQIDWPDAIRRRLRYLAIVLRLTILLNHLDPVEALSNFHLQAVGEDGLVLSFPEGTLLNRALALAELEQEKDYLAAIGFGLRIIC